MRQNQSGLEQKRSNVWQRIALIAILLMGVSFVVVACTTSYTRPNETGETAGDDTEIGSTEQTTVQSGQAGATSEAITMMNATPSPRATLDATHTPSPTMSPTMSPTISPPAISPEADASATPITISPLAEGASADESFPYTITYSLSEPLSSAVPATAVEDLNDLLALTVTQPLTLTNGTPISLSLGLTAELAMSVTTPLTVGVDLTTTSLVTQNVDGGTALLLIPTPTPAIEPPQTANQAPAPTPDGISRTVQLPILMYHYVSIPPAEADIYRRDLSIAPADFAAHLDRMLADGYTAISLYDFLDHLTQGAPLPDKPVIITFDDGYRDNYANAFPALAERDMTATFFVVTDFIDEERDAYFSWDMLREMSDAGMFIESHGRNHVTLKGQGTDYLVWQALGSMETIEYELGKRPRFISYPAGEYDQTTTDLFKSANYWAGLTTVQGATHDSENLFELRRVRVRGTTTPDELSRLLSLDW